MALRLELMVLSSAWELVTLPASGQFQCYSCLPETTDTRINNQRSIKQNNNMYKITNINARSDIFLEIFGENGILFRIYSWSTWYTGLSKEFTNITMTVLHY